MYQAVTDSKINFWRTLVPLTEKYYVYAALVKLVFGYKVLESIFFLFRSGCSHCDISRIRNVVPVPNTPISMHSQLESCCFFAGRLFSSWCFLLPHKMSHNKLLPLSP